MIWINKYRLKMIKPLVFTFCLFFFQWVLSQSDTIKYKHYSSDFRFREGIYLNFEQVKYNQPVAKQNIISTVNPYDLYFFEKILDEQTIAFYDQFGVRNEVKTSQIWGFSRKGALYINYSGDFNRIPVVGSICHFVATVIVYEDRYPSSYYSPYYYGYQPTRQTSSEIRQFLLDFETGRVMEFTTDNVLIFLARDKELYDEYNNLSNRKKRQLKFLYIRKYNEKHPIMFPVK